MSATRVPPPAQARSLRSELIRWFRRHRRDLPWRRTRDPYAIWVAEVMLQQTQVRTVLPYYSRFLERFPDVASLARADEDAVLALWSGLGYYRRARALHAGAREVVERFAGKLPREAAALRRVPGIGRYTAGAIASTAFGLREPVLDGNVRRVLSRLFALDERRAGRAPTERVLWSIAARLADGPAPGDLNQGLMELGALVCRPRDPECPACPLATHCRARREGDPTRYPAPRSSGPTRHVRVAVALLTRAGRVLLERPGEDNPLRGSWDLPAVEIARDADGATTLEREITRRHRLRIGVAPCLASAAHGIMQSRLRLEIHPGRVRRGRVSDNDRLRWVATDALAEVATSGATRKILRLSAEANHSARTERTRPSR